MKLATADEIKLLCPRGLAAQAQLMRTFLIQSLSRTGGHLASNLGAVELTIALHRVFTTPADKIIWDVGHQSYVHKILTGRGPQFDTLRTCGGISGFPSLAESEHDGFGTGHSSTAISAALGLARARDLQGGSGHVVAVVGDGSLTGGLAYEGLNNAGRAKTNLLVVLNDNEMSIAKNVGALQKHLNEIRAHRGYQRAKRRVHKWLDYFPGIGTKIRQGTQIIKETMKFAILPGVLFREMGFRYLGPVDGHDIAGLSAVFCAAREIPGPVLVHCITKKGKGFCHAEDMPRKFHGVGPFCVRSGNALGRADATTESFTDAFGEHLTQLAHTNPKIVAITAAMPDGVGLGGFARAHPKRFFDVGIAEGHAVTFAAGLAAGGMRPVVAVYSSFLQRAYDQILHDVALQNLGVVFMLDRAGAVDADGPTHQGIFDIAYLASIPGMVVLAPANTAQLVQMLDFALSHAGPVAIRYPKEAALLPLPARPLDFARPQVICAAGDFAIVAAGPMVHEAMQAAQMLQNTVDIAIYNARFLHPLCADFVRSLLRHKHIVCVEDGIHTGGFGQKLAAALAMHKNSPYVTILAYPDVVPGVMTRREAFAQNGLDAHGIAEKIKCLGGFSGAIHRKK